MKKMLLAIASLCLGSSLWADTVNYSGGNLYEQNLLLKSTEPGKLGNYLLYVPNSLQSTSSERKLIVMLHGCTQRGQEFFDGTNIRKYADKMGLLVLLPQQSEQMNPYNCWNWVLPSNQVKAGPFTSNEPKLILEAIDQVRMKYGIRDNQNIFLAGMSAGAAMANILASCYPKRFASVALSHGVQYAGAAWTWWDVEGLKALGTDGSAVDPEITGLAAYTCAMMGEMNPWPIFGSAVPAIIFHGDSGIMTYQHAEQTEKQFLVGYDYLDNGLRDGSFALEQDSKFVDAPEGKYSYDVFSTYHNDKLVIERYKIHGLGHAWSGGIDEFGFFDHRGPDATKLMIQFFKKYGL